MKTSTRRLPPCLALALCGLSLLPAVPAAAQAYGEQTDVVAVEVPVQVVKDGAPVRGLTANDFEVYEGRKKQTIVDFDVVDLTAPASATAQTPAAPLPVSARRHFLLLFDLSFSEPKSVSKARDAARNLVSEKLAPTDVVAVATYNSRGTQILLGFSPDRRQVDRAIEAVGLPEMVDRNPDPLKLMAADLRKELLSTDVKARDNEPMLEDIEMAARESARAEETRKKNQVTALSRSFTDMAKLMNSVVGRKYVVYLSEGFDSSILSGTTEQADIDQINQSVTDGEFYKVDTASRYGNTEASNDLEKMMEEFRRADCIIQSVDIGGLRGGDLNPQRRTGQDGLFLMAHDTGGELYRDFNNLGEAMDQMLQRTSVTYVLTLQPEGLRRDGTYHRLRVELKNAPKGARVVHRPGYYAPRPFTQQSGVEKSLQAANQILSGGDGGAISTAVLAAPFRRPGEDKAYVPVLVEVDGPGLLAGHQGNAVPAEIYIYALDAQGGVQDFRTQTVGLDVAKTGDALRRSGLKFFGHVDLPPGAYSLRVLVRNGATGTYGMRVVPVAVPAFAQATPVLLPPLFPEPQGKWLLVPEALREGEKRPDYPFMLDKAPFVPASSPVLGAGQEARLELAGWNLGDGDLQGTARVTTADGKEIPGSTLKLAQRERGAGAAPDRLVATFHPGKLPAGEYHLTIQLTGAAGTVTSAPLRFTVS